MLRNVALTKWKRYLLMITIAYVIAGKRCATLWKRFRSKIRDVAKIVTLPFRGGNVCNGWIATVTREEKIEETKKTK